MIQKNPAIGSVIKGKEKDQNIKFIDSSDISPVLKVARKYGYIYWIFFYFLIETGMRKGEAAALQWSDINFKESKINVSKTLDFQAKDQKDLFADPKTYNSKRVITVRKNVMDKLRFHLSWQNENKTVLEDEYNYDLNLVFCRENGDFMPKSSLFNAFKRILDQAGIPNLPIHSLRHTHAVLLMESKWDMKAIQERLGHGSYQITADVYAHISDRIQQEDMANYDNHMSEIIKE